MIDSLKFKTQQRLLEAAGEVFASHGFRKATVREICKRAHANVASVNYYFHDKKALYSAVLQYAHQCALERYPPDHGLRKNATVQERLRTFIQSFLLRFLDDGRPAWHGKLIAREMIEPTQALDVLVEKEIRPLSQRLEAIIREFLNTRADTERVQLCARSIVAQCIFYYHARSVINRLYPNQKYDRHGIEQLTDHITRFSLGALKELRKHIKAVKP
ncbi:MAG: DUF1956 domain-containing protein [wastewater metagenome]|nr:DUF1956 domain-containing protein [Candidatus Loosdrechtia aerotolerans]